MPRKAVNPAASGGTSELRRSTRIKDQPIKQEKAPKSRGKKADKGSADMDGKNPRGKKRKAEEEEVNGEVDNAEAPAEKKVRFFFLVVVEIAFLRHLICDLIG